MRGWIFGIVYIGAVVTCSPEQVLADQQVTAQLRKRLIWQRGLAASVARARARVLCKSRPRTPCQVVQDIAALVPQRRHGGQSICG
jgi:hypothetical protein